MPRQERRPASRGEERGIGRERRNFHVDNLGCAPIGPETSAKKAWGPHFGPKWGFAFKFPHNYTAHVFLDERISSGDAGQIARVIEEGLIGHVITCEDNEWVVRSEPLGGGRFGIVVYTADGRAMMSGTGEVKEDGSYTARAETLYPGIRNAKKHTAKVSCTGKSDGTYSCTGSVGIEW